jgi:copper(I)-binding protein
VFIMVRLAFVTLLLFSVASCAKPTGLEVKDAWTRDTVGGTVNAAVFMTIRSGSPDRLIAASAPVAKKTDLMTIEGGSSAMKMKYLQGIDIPANTPVSLNPTGLHVWLDGLNQPLKAGQTFPLSLRFQKAGERRVIVSIIEPAAAPPASELQM